MNRMRMIAAITYAIGWISIVVGVIYRFWLYHGNVARIGSANILPHNLMQLSLLAFVIAIASDNRCSSHSG
jgi:hypothetical protein